MNRRITILFAALVAAQVVGLVVFSGVRQTVLSQGREVVLQTVPVDPRSLLQGDYAILDYEIAELPDSLRKLPVGETVDVGLKEGPEVWYATFYQSYGPDGLVGGPVHDLPRGGRLEGEVYIRGRVNDRGRLDFGIGTYFVPEGTGHIIERARDVKVVVAIGERGNAVIKRVLVDGEPFDPGG